MLSRENAKFRSALDKTNSQMNKDKTLKEKPIQTRGVRIKRRINPNTFLTVLTCGLMALIEDFKNNWLIVSQMLVAIISRKIKSRPSFTTRPPSSVYCSATPG